MIYLFVSARFYSCDLEPTFDDEMPDKLEDAVQQRYFAELVRLQKRDDFQQPCKEPQIFCVNEFTVANTAILLNFESSTSKFVYV